MPRLSLTRLMGVVLVLLLLGSAPAVAGMPRNGRQVGPAANRITWSFAGSYVLGDSISAWGSEELLAKRSEWVVNAVHGRPVNTLSTLVGNVMAVDKHPFRVVVELGSNQSPGWTRADYAAAIAKLPASTRVLLVEPYKAPGTRWHAYGVRMTAAYTRWMRSIARQRPHTCVVPWRSAAAAHPEWLRDGLHPTDDAYANWADLILQTDRTCS